MKPRLGLCLVAAALSASQWACGQEPVCTEQKLAAPNGPGVRVYKDCKREEGTFRNGELWGLAKVTGSDGTVFEGEFIGGRLFGHGKVTRKPPDMRWYEGMFHEGVPSGPGRYRDEYGIVANGFFHNGAILGAGVKVWPHGGKLIGEFRPGLGGIGTFVAVFPDGNQASGSYRPMFGKLQMYKPAAGAPTPAANPPPANAPPPKPSEPAKAKQASEQVEKAVDLLRGLIKK